MAHIDMKALSFSESTFHELCFRWFIPEMQRRKFSTSWMHM